MPKSYRIRTQPGVDKSVKIQLDQDFDYLEILSLKILQRDIYTRVCSDYGVIVGRVSVNNGFGVPNAKVSVFIPLSEEDLNNPIISQIYPYTSVNDVNEDGYRYNLLPYEKSYPTHAATGTFPSREDVLTNSPIIEVYDKYYKFTVKTNESGDYMIFGVPTGTQTLFMDVDLSDIGCFSLSPQDLIDSGRATETQVNGNKFKSSSNLSELPQIVSLSSTIEVQPLWGEPEICLLGITRKDFDLTSFASINIQPTAVFMGSIVSTTNEDSLKRNCKPKINTGNMCDLVTGPGQILAIRQTIDTDINGDPILEQYTLNEDGKIIDGNGTWLTNLPMNMDYVTTNEFGEQVISNDPSIGIPTKGKYRFRIRWQNEEGLRNNFMRGDYLVPNVKEHGWFSQTIDPTSLNVSNYDFQFAPGITAHTITNIPAGGLVFSNSVNAQQNFNVIINGVPYYGGIDSIPLENAFNNVQILSNPIDGTQPQNIIFTYYPQSYFDVIQSYAFSLDWDDYVDKQSAINCEDTFYEFNYNKVYTVSSFIDRYKNGKNRSRHLGIKEITDRSCQSENNKFPVNDLVRNFDFIFFLTQLILNVLTIPLIVILAVSHFIALTWPVFKWVLIVGIPALFIYLATQAALTIGASFPAVGLIIVNAIYVVLYVGLTVLFSIYVIPKLLQVKKLQKIALPMISYPDCDACPCEVKESDYDEINDGPAPVPQDVNSSFLADVSISTMYSLDNENKTPTYDDIEAQDPEVLGDAQNQYLEIFSGIDDTGSDYRRGSRYFLTKKTGSSDRLGYPLTETWPQKLNAFNLRDTYFNGFNIIETRINGSNPINDQIFVVLVDWGLQQNFLAGDIVTFQNPTMSGDIERLTGFTQINQFGFPSITGATYTGTTTIPIYYADPNNPNWDTNLVENVQVNQTTNDGSYRFPADIEYFQVITGMSVSEFQTIATAQNNPSLFPNNYLLHKIKYRYNDYDGTYAPLEGQEQAFYQFKDGVDLGIVFFTRGVDPYTDRQTIQYDLSRIFGYNNFGQTNCIFTGQYKINYPIRGYNNGKKPVEHNVSNNSPITNNTDRKIYYPSFTYIPNQVMMNDFPNNNSLLPYYYLSTDNDNSGILPYYQPIPNFSEFMGSLINPSTNALFETEFCEDRMLPYNNIANNNPLESYAPFGYPYYVGGGTFLFANLRPDYGLDPFYGNNFENESFWSLYSPSYRGFAGTPALGLNGVDFNNNLGIVMRSDRLPTSTTLEGPNVNPYTLYALHQNNKFAYYKIPDSGVVDLLQTLSLVSDGASGNLDDSDIPSGLTGSLTCEGMVSLSCYEGYGTSFTVNETCANTDDVINGCYYLLNKPHVLELDNDIAKFLEWKSRFLVMFGACRGVFGHMFQNNWINGTLYMPSFNKQTVFNILGQPRYNYCDDVIFYNDVTNSFFYRSSPWNGTQFIGAPSPDIDDDSKNDRQILFPTTILDMGKRDEFISEICANPDFQGRYLANTFMSSSYNDSSDLLQLGIISRLTNSTWGSQLFSTGAASINQFFSRSGDRIDGDIAQSFSINSEYQINPFIGGNYPDNFIYVGEDSTGPVFGVFYNATGVTNNSQYRNRRALSPGINIYNFSPILQNSYGYPKSQEVPLYKWKITPSNTIFGNENNNWKTTANTNQTLNGFYSQRYQELDAIGDDYFKTPLMSPSFPNIYYGFITNFNSSGNPQTLPQPIKREILVGAPNHFYFGLKNGNTALNRFIKIYIDTEQE